MEAKLLKDINTKHEEWDKTNYIPRNRYGKYQLQVIKDGQLYESRQTDSKAELQKWSRTYQAQGFETQIGTILPRMDSEHYVGVSKEVEENMAPFDSADPVGGFKKHLMKSRRIKGADADVARSWAEYARGLSKKIALERMELDFEEAMFNLPRDPRDPKAIDINLSPAVAEIQKRKEAMLDPKSNWWKMTSKAVDLKNLTFQLRTPLGNMFVIPNRQYPELGKYVKNPAVQIAKGFKVNLDRMRMSDDAFAKRYPDIAQGVAAAEAKGVVSSSFAKKVSRVADNKNKALSTADDVAFFLQSHSDRFADANGFITGWLAYPDAVKTLAKSKQPLPDRQTFAEQFAIDTKANVKTELLPTWMQGAGQSTFFKYKAWQFRYLGALKQAAGEGNWPYVARALGATVATGGLRALPFYKTIVSAMNAMGINPEKALEEYLSDNTASTVLYGPPSVLTGTNISGAVGFGDPLPDASRGLDTALGSLVGGPPLSIINKLVKDVPQFAKEGRYDRVVENLPLVPLVTDLAKMYRYGKEGVVTKSNTNILPKSEVDAPLMLKQLLGFGDMRVARGYDKYMAGSQAQKDAKSKVNYNALIAEALDRGEPDKVNRLIGEAVSKGFPPDMGSVQEILLRRQGVESAVMKRIPKKARGEVAKARQRYED
jgi:hypothetical protein